MIYLVLIKYTVYPPTKFSSSSTGNGHFASSILFAIPNNAHLEVIPVILDTQKLSFQKHVFCQSSRKGQAVQQ